MKSIFFIITGVLLMVGCKEEASIPMNTNPIPRILELNPGNAVSGDLLSIKGLHFSENVNELEVKFNQILAEVVAASETEVNVIVPEIDGSLAHVTVRSRGKISNRKQLLLIATKRFSDDFNRADVALVDESVIPNPIGEKWQILWGGFELKSNALMGTVGGGDMFIVHQDPELDMKVGGNHYFKFSADVQVSANSWGGVVFNVVPSEQQHYRLRINNNELQLLKIRGGNMVGLPINEAVSGLAANRPFRIEVSSARQGQIVIKITDINESGTVFERTIEDADPLLGGTAGYYYLAMAHPIEIYFDNFDVETM